MEWDHPFDVGMTGLIGFSSGYHAMLGCDTLVMLGTNFLYRNFYPTDAKVVRSHIRPEAIGKRTLVDLGLVGDFKSAIGALLPRLRRRGDRSFLKRARAHYTNACIGLDELAYLRPATCA